MAALKRRAELILCAVLLLTGPPAIAQLSSSDLYAQATQAMLDRSFPSARVEYLLLDLRTRQPIAMRWKHEETAIPVGSLLKPFVAMAWNDLHAGPRSHAEIPVVRCHGRSDGCWRAEGHGDVALERALAVSCNAYFLALARDLIGSGTAGRTALNRIGAAYGLPSPPADASPRGLIGAVPGWRIAPIVLARAYARLVTEQADRNTVQSRLMSGMALAARPGGTAAGVGAHADGVLAKTGTAPCITNVERCVADGDGLTIVLAPAASPRLLLLVREHGTTGAATAIVAGEMLSRIEKGDGSAGTR